MTTSPVCPLPQVTRFIHDRDFRPRRDAHIAGTLTSRSGLLVI